MTAEDWVQGLDLPNLLRYADQIQIRGLIATAIREAVAVEREAIAQQIDNNASVLKDMSDARKEDWFARALREMAAGVRKRVGP